MLKTFSNLKIAHKLVAISMLSTIVALLIGVVVMLGYNNLSYRNSVDNNLTQITTLITAQLQDSIKTQDKGAATKSLSSLEVNPDVILGCLYRIENGMYKLFSSWSGGKGTDSICPEYSDSQLSINDSSINIKHTPISVDQEIIGSFYLELKQKQQNSTSVEFILFTLGLALLIIFPSYAISSRLQKFALTPLQNLTQIFATVLEDKDYSIRSSITSTDELGKLAVSFNNILSTIDQQNVDLQESKTKFNSLIIALQESEERFRAIFEQAGDSIVLVNIYDGKFYEHNRIAHQTLGYNSEEFSQLPLVFLNLTILFPVHYASFR